MNPSRSTSAPSSKVIWAATDPQTAAVVAEALRLDETTQVTAVFQDTETAQLYDAEPRVRAVAWAPLLAREIVEEFGPYPLHRVAPEPVVVGDNAFAGHLVRALIEGWCDPGQQLPVHCVGQHTQWVQEAESETSPRGRLTWSEVALRPAPVARRVAELAAFWPQPKPKRGTPAGPTVIVSLSDASRCLAVAAAVSRAVENSRVAAVVDDAAIWPVVPGVTIFSIAEARAAAAAREHSALDRLVVRLLSDTAWMSAPDAEATKPLAPLFAAVNYRSDGRPFPLAEQSSQLRAQLGAVAERIEDILASGAVVCGDVNDGLDAAIIVSPTELGAMADAILTLLGVADTPDTRLTALELAFRLPSLASRAGLIPRRPAGYEPLLSIELVESLAPMVHLAYQDVSAETGNATGSSLAYELWDQLNEFERAGNRAVLVGSAVCHAAVGLAWRFVQSPAAITVDESRIERLAELEHRRWALHQRRNGAPDHQWSVAWSQMDDGTKLYDVRIMERVFGILADAGIEVYETEAAPRQSLGKR